MALVVGLLSLIEHLNVCIMKTVLGKVTNCSLRVDGCLPVYLTSTISSSWKHRLTSVSWYKFADSSNVGSLPATQHLVIFHFKTIKFTIFKIANQQTCFHPFCFKLVDQVGLSLHTFWIFLSEVHQTKMELFNVPNNPLLFKCNDNIQVFVSSKGLILWFWLMRVFW